MAPRIFFDFREIVPAPLPTVTVVDVGASALTGQAPFYQPLTALGVSRVIGFEPDPAACAQLNAHARPQDRFLPLALGDGSTGEFRSCASPYTSSLLEPNRPLLELFQNLAELCVVRTRTPMPTRRLDDIPDVAEVDLLKLDVQGAELQVITGGPRTLQRALVVETEVEFVPLYVGQPLFAEVDQALRAAGLVFHRFLGLAGRAFKPLQLKEDVNKPISQTLWADAVYVRDFTRLHELDPLSLLKMALILHSVYGSVDLAHACLRARDRRTGAKDSERYLARFA